LSLISIRPKVPTADVAKLQILVYEPTPQDSAGDWCVLL